MTRRRAALVTGGVLAISSPADLSGLALWLDASDAATRFTDTGGTTAATAEGALVARWNDKSGNARHATQDTAGSRPALNLAAQNGRAVLYFNGDYLTSSLNPSSVMSEGLTVCVTAKLDDTSARTWSWLYGETVGSGSPSGFFFGKTGTGGDRIMFAASNWHDSTDTASVSPFVGSWHQLTHQESDAVRRVGLDGTLVHNAANGNSSLAATTFNVGGRAAVEPWRGPVGELVVYNRVLTSTERQQVEGYLRSRWATP